MRSYSGSNESVRGGGGQYLHDPRMDEAELNDGRPAERQTMSRRIVRIHHGHTLPVTSVDTASQAICFFIFALFYIMDTEVIKYIRYTYIAKKNS